MHPSSPVLRADGVGLAFGARPVLQDVSLAVAPGHRAGLVGENGVGKSTLLRVLAGRLTPDVGTVARPRDLALLDQELPYPPTTRAARVIEDAIADLRAIETRLLAAGERLADTPDDVAVVRAYDVALAEAERAEVWEVDVRIARTLAGLGLERVIGAERRDAAVGELSGGERTRLGLAALLLRRPSALLLDEPTNHLDDDAAAFLAAELTGLPGAVLMASHDRTFLEEAATEIVDLDPGASPEPPPVTYGGRYSDYLRQRQVERERWQQRYESEQDELRSLRHAVATTARDVAPGRGPRDNDKFLYDFKDGRVNKGVSRRVRNATLRLETLEREQVRKPRPPSRFSPPTGGPRGRVPDGGLVAWAHHVSVAGRLDMDAAGLPVLEIGAGSRLLLTGANGSGKSTLLHVLAGDLAPTSGSAGTTRGVRVGLLEQDLHLDGERRTPRQLMAAAAGTAAAAGERPDVDSHGLVAPRDLDREVGELSVGTRRRVVLAMLVTQAPDVLLLDEPTNHVSLALADELVGSIADWPGAVVVASHDRWLRGHWPGEVVGLTAPAGPERPE